MPPSGVADSLAGEAGQERGKEEIPETSNRRHLASGVNAAAEDNIGFLKIQSLAQVSEEAGVAGAAGIEEG